MLNRRTIKNMCCFLLVCISGQWARAQDIHFSQFFETPLLRNPSLSGIFNGDVRVQAVYRDQWNSFTNAYRTGSFNAEYKIPAGSGDDFMTLAVQALFDKAGSVGLSTTQLLPALNYHKSLSRDHSLYLSFGCMGGMIRKTIDASRMTTNEQYVGGYDPGLPTGETAALPHFTTWDAAAGLSLNAAFGQQQRNSLFAGFALHHLNRPKNSFYRNPEIELEPKYVFSGGLRLRVDDFSSFILQTDHSVQGSFTETVAGVLYAYSLGGDPDQAEYTLHGGGFLRWKDAVIPVIKLDKYPLSVAISYDVNVSRLKTASQGRGGFEISFAYIGFLDRYSSSRDRLLCPRF